MQIFQKFQKWAFLLYFYPPARVTPTPSLELYFGIRICIIMTEPNFEPSERGQKCRFFENSKNGRFCGIFTHLHARRQLPRSNFILELEFAPLRRSQALNPQNGVRNADFLKITKMGVFVVFLPTRTRDANSLARALFWN